MTQLTRPWHCSSKCANLLYAPQVVKLWELFAHETRKVQKLTVQDINVIARAMGGLGDWKGIVSLLGSASTRGGRPLPSLDLRR